MPLPTEVLELIDPVKPAFIQIDMQRRHVDPNVGYHLVDPAKTTSIVSASTSLAQGRASGTSADDTRRHLCEA